MLAGDFQRKLRKLNKNLRICCGNDKTKPAGLFFSKYGEYVEICGIDKNEMPENTIYDEMGHIIKAGWRRPLKFLIERKLVDLKEAEKLFKADLKRGLKRINLGADPAIKQIQAVEERAMRKRGIDENGNPLMNRDDIMEMGWLVKQLRR